MKDNFQNYSYSYNSTLFANISENIESKIREINYNRQILININNIEDFFSAKLKLTQFLFSLEDELHEYLRKYKNMFIQNKELSEKCEIYSNQIQNLNNKVFSLENLNNQQKISLNELFNENHFLKEKTYAKEDYIRNLEEKLKNLERNLTMKNSFIMEEDRFKMNHSYFQEENNYLRRNEYDKLEYNYQNPKLLNNYENIIYEDKPRKLENILKDYNNNNIQSKKDFVKGFLNNYKIQSEKNIDQKNVRRIENEGMNNEKGYKFEEENTNSLYEEREKGNLKMNTENNLDKNTNDLSQEVNNIPVNKTVEIENLQVIKYYF